ncbi:MAG TPA: hypothetical protein VJ919_15610 [Tangfeifania sp.]|nr:hypothetical protein [Tangfeifania sp.]
MKNKRLVIIPSVVMFPLLVPLIAMQFTSEVNWTLFDFIVAAFLLFIAAMAVGLIIRKVKDKTYRIIFSAVVLALFLLIWAEIAVGIFGTPFAGT